MSRAITQGFYACPKETRERDSNYSDTTKARLLKSQCFTTSATQYYTSGKRTKSLSKSKAGSLGQHIAILMVHSKVYGSD
jgi:hypothetical protein